MPRRGRCLGNQPADNNHQRLGDCIGKGAFGSVYKAFNWGTGEAVAVKQIKLTNVPKSELRMIEVRETLFSGFPHDKFDC